MHSCWQIDKNDAYAGIKTAISRDNSRLRQKLADKVCRLDRRFLNIFTHCRSYQTRDTQWYIMVHNGTYCTVVCPLLRRSLRSRDYRENCHREDRQSVRWECKKASRHSQSSSMKRTASWSCCFIYNFLIIYNNLHTMIYLLSLTRPRRQTFILGQ